MNKPLAIKTYCFECAGGSNKEVTLCVVFDCPLWEWRFGYPMKSKRFWQRMKTATVNYREDMAETHRGTIDIRPFFPTDATHSAFLKSNGLEASCNGSQKLAPKSEAIVNPIRRRPSDAKESKGDRQGAISLSPELTLADGREA